MTSSIAIRAVEVADYDQIWDLLKPVFRAGDTYAIATDISRAAALAYWCGPQHMVWVATRQQTIIGTYYRRINQAGGGDHVCNCGFITHPEAQGQGVARKLLQHALGGARHAGFRAMQFNFVVATNHRALTLWQRAGFDIVGRLPAAFRHPEHGDVEAFILYRQL